MALGPHPQRLLTGMPRSGSPGSPDDLLDFCRLDVLDPRPIDLQQDHRHVVVLWRVAEAGADNVRFCSVDAVWTLENLLGPASLAELWTFFPDPWRKTKHRKRRLVNPANAALASSRLVPGGAWRLATDCADYADQMREVLDAEPTLEGGRVERWGERPVTRFERKGLDVGRDIVDLLYRRSVEGEPGAAQDVLEA